MTGPPGTARHRVRRQQLQQRSRQDLLGSTPVMSGGSKDQSRGPDLDQTSDVSGQVSNVISRFRILPVGPLGSTPNCTMRGYL